jgi:hypothetical protein
MTRLLDRLDALDDRLIPGYPRDNPPLWTRLLATLGIPAGFAAAYFLGLSIAIAVVAGCAGLFYGVRAWRQRHQPSS